MFLHWTKKNRKSQYALAISIFLYNYLFPNMNLSHCNARVVFPWPRLRSLCKAQKCLSCRIVQNALLALTPRFVQIIITTDLPIIAWIWIWNVFNITFDEIIRIRSLMFLLFDIHDDEWFWVRNQTWNKCSLVFMALLHFMQFNTTVLSFSNCYHQ